MKQPTRYPNTGRKPVRWERVMVQLRNGTTAGPWPVATTRFEPWPWGESAFDVTEFWQAE